MIVKFKRIESQKCRVKPIFDRCMEFHISRRARMKYDFDETLFSMDGNIIFPNFHAARLFAQKINEMRDLINFPEQAVRAGQINAMGLLDEILHRIIRLYREQIDRKIIFKLLDWLDEKFGKEKVNRILYKFLYEFPSKAIYTGEISPENYLKRETQGVPNREIAMEELLLLWFASQNPAFSLFKELFDDSGLMQDTDYKEIILSVYEFFNMEPGFGPENQNLIDMLGNPAVEEPASLSGQLEHIKKEWGFVVEKEKYYEPVLRSIDFIKEEEKIRVGGAGISEVVEFRQDSIYFEPEQFSPDTVWMPKMVLLAKNGYVWLDQLSKKYKREIKTLDQIPDEELDIMARWGITGLWLIGLWERSPASKTIKQLCGNLDAEASAYSIFEYAIAKELGGEKAFDSLRDRAWKKKIRMCGDLVPNHVSIDSTWVTGHPELFISLDYCPFPSYSFTGPDLSPAAGVGIFVEDHYFDRTDASVVFKYVDYLSGEVKYIYHGNDGTSMPWNDTAQLNYLKPEVRETIIQTILKIAQKFPMIRFDAAMTLVKRHFQRLWYPEPGGGGDIPTRTEHGLTKAKFNQLVPREFWRDVVDRIAEEAPDTLLLAEAFWLMEGYFVRTLGMHRVYNSAFMNMLKNEENAKYRTTVKNVLDFDPEVLKRHVNFMTNPDEETAAAQFGKGDKYFGVCIMMITMPGLPMFGHGQIEAFTEKYGMEFKRAYRDEKVDLNFLKRHEQIIFPLLRKRYLFAEVENFLFYDFVSGDSHGVVDENVFAYSNRNGDERALVVYNNKFQRTRGFVAMSVPYTVKSGEEYDQATVQMSLGEGLGLHNGSDYYVIFRDEITNLEYIQNSKDIHDRGLKLSLGAYHFIVFLNIREVRDDSARSYEKLNNFLNGLGVPDIEDALREMALQPVHSAFRELVNKNMFLKIIQSKLAESEETVDNELLDEVKTKMILLLEELKKYTAGRNVEQEIAKKVRNELKIVLGLQSTCEKLISSKTKATKLRQGLEFLQKYLEQGEKIWLILFGFLSVHHNGGIVDADDEVEQSYSGITEWFLGKILNITFRDLGYNDSESYLNVLMIKILTRHGTWWNVRANRKRRSLALMEKLLKDPDIQIWLKVNRFQDILWFNKEAFDALAGWLFTISVLNVFETAKGDGAWLKKAAAGIALHFKTIEELVNACERSTYQVPRLLEELGTKKKRPVRKRRGRQR